jgi:hypothetical protein
MKFEPLIVSVWAAAPTRAEEGDKVVTTGVGLLLVVVVVEPPPPPPPPQPVMLINSPRLIAKTSYLRHHTRIIDPAPSTMSEVLWVFFEIKETTTIAKLSEASSKGTLP